jgi:uncharacterized Zn ribbon protein
MQAQSVEEGGISWRPIVHLLGGQMVVSARVASRISTQLKKYQSVLRDAKQRDISEADTVTIIKDILAQ